ncbi:MAG: hypothetical protein OXH99_04055 [Bryobacterales bacterium]|nr:hypothetical protein [Bryobacterales bacterium]
MRVRTRLAPIGAGAVLAILGSVQPLVAETAGRTLVLEDYAERFRDEIYPLLADGAGACTACHHAESSQLFQVLSSPGATFSLLLERGLLDPSDPMAVPGRVATTDMELRMPKAGALADGDIEAIAEFSRGLQDALGRHGGSADVPHDERFPDGLLLPYDGEEQSERAQRRLSYYQLRHSLASIFGADWLASSGTDPFEHKARAFGGADFRSSFDQSRTLTASYLSAMQEVSREVGRRFVSAPRNVLFEDFDPEVYAHRSPRAAASNVRTLYRRILFAEPSQGEVRRALQLVRELQRRTDTRRIVRFTMSVEDADGRRARRDVDVSFSAADASVSRHIVDQSRAPAGDPWVRVGNAPFRFESANPDHFVRLAARPGNHVTAFDAVKLVRSGGGEGSPESVVLDNLDPECALSGEWEPVEKEGERSRAGGPKRKYDMDLHVIGSNHLESRSVDNRLATATVALRIPEDGDYDIYLSWPRIPRLSDAVLVEVHSATGTPPPPVAWKKRSPGFATVFLDQTESTLDSLGETQWEPIHRKVLLKGPDDYVEVSNRGVDSVSKVIVADAVRFVPLGPGPEIVVDNLSDEGFEASDGWAPDKLVRNLPGRGKMYGEDILHYPPSKSGAPIEDHEVDADSQVWARYRPVRDGQYQPGWYDIHVWTPGGHTHADWVPFDIHGSAFAPVASVEAPPGFIVGETGYLDAGATYHPLGKALSFRWTHDAGDLGLQIEGATTPVPRFRIPHLRSPRTGWAGLIEALLQRPEFVMPHDGTDALPSARLVRVALDLVGRVPAQDELRRFERDGRLGDLIDTYLASEDFKQFFFHRARGAFRSRGTPESDEPARLWTYIATNDLSYRELYTADYTVGADWKLLDRRPVHGPTGFLTMKGYLEGKPGLPKFTYPAEVLTFALGVQFEVSDAVEDARDKVVSTTDPRSICYSCHKLLTPLAYQRERWDVHGHYRSVDDSHEPIDDSDRGVVPDYPFKGSGLQAFASQVVRKERFVRRFINLHHDMLFHRHLRVHEDQREDYRHLYRFAVAKDLRIRPLLKRMILMRYGEAPGEI